MGISPKPAKNKLDNLSDKPCDDGGYSLSRIPVRKIQHWHCLSKVEFRVMQELSLNPKETRLQMLLRHGRKQHNQKTQPTNRQSEFDACAFVCLLCNTYFRVRRICLFWFLILSCLPADACLMWLLCCVVVDSSHQWATYVVKCCFERMFIVFADLVELIWAQSYHLLD